jgi:integrase
MLRPSIGAYLALRRAVGFRLPAEESLLHNFARWAVDRGDTHVRTQTATEWAAAARSLWQRERRLRAVASFARYARAEDPRHEVPPIFVFGRRHVRPRPHIYSPDELRRLLDAATRLPAIWPLRPSVFTTLFGLLASSGVRVSEALALRCGDVTSDGLVIRKTKFNKSRLVPLHDTAASALGRYLELRRRASLVSDYVFVSPKGGRLPSQTVSKTFLYLARHAGLRSGPGTPGPRIHDLPHLCRAGSGGVSARREPRRLAHARVVDLPRPPQPRRHVLVPASATPPLMRGVADACERFLEGGAR